MLLRLEHVDKGDQRVDLSRRQDILAYFRSVSIDGSESMNRLGDWLSSDPSVCRPNLLI